MDPLAYYRMMEQAVRRQLEQKQALHNIVIAAPFFIASRPTTLVAVRVDNDLTTNSNYQEKVYWNGSRFSRTKILSFPTVQQAKQFHAQYSARAVEQPQSKLWCEYCKELTPVEGILYHIGKIYVSAPQSKLLRDLLNDISQMTVVDGFAFEQALRQSKHPLFKFVDNNILSLEYIYYRWRVYAYLQGDGEKRYHNAPFRLVEDGPEWYPPSLASLPRGVLNHQQRKYFHELLFKLTRKKSQVEEVMAFAIFNMGCAVDIAAILALEIQQKLTEGQDFVKYFYLISDILFNTTAQNYRRLFARLIPFFVHRYSKLKKDGEHKFRGELRALIQLWEIKFIFDENYTQGLLFLLSDSPPHKSISIHDKLKQIGNIQDDREGQVQLQKLCFENGIPLLENNKEESTELINQYLWSHSPQQPQAPVANQQLDGDPILEKDLLKIRNKQVKVICCQGTTLQHLLDKNWQTKTKKNSVDQQ